MRIAITAYPCHTEKRLSAFRLPEGVKQMITILLAAALTKQVSLTALPVNPTVKDVVSYLQKQDQTLKVVFPRDNYQYAPAREVSTSSAFINGNSFYFLQVAGGLAGPKKPGDLQSKLVCVIR